MGPTNLDDDTGESEAEVEGDSEEADGDGSGSGSEDTPGGTPHDLTGFQRDTLKEIIRLGQTRESPPHGLALKDRLEMTYDGKEIFHGRLYPNLDTLVQKGLVNKIEKDQRTNGYTVTRRGRREYEDSLKDQLSALSDEDITAILTEIGYRPTTGSG